MSLLYGRGACLKSFPGFPKNFFIVRHFMTCLAPFIINSLIQFLIIR